MSIRRKIQKIVPQSLFHLRDGVNEIIQPLGSEDFVEFETAKSTDFLSQCDRKIDLIFLDGSHAASDVYQEIAFGMNVLKDGELYVAA